MGRILSGESRSQTSQERVRCGLQGRPPAGIVHQARESAQGTSVFLAAAEPLAQGSKKKPVRAVFGQKGLLWGLLGLESREIEKKNKFIPLALPFSRTIPVRTPQSASRTEESKSWMSRGLVADRRSYQMLQAKIPKYQVANHVQIKYRSRPSPSLLATQEQLSFRRMT